MAKELDSYDWDESRSGGRSKYDWGRWTKGDIWRIRQGDDYEIATETMRVTLHAKAEQKGLKVRTRKENDQDGESLVFQFFDPADLSEEPSP